MLAHLGAIHKGRPQNLTVFYPLPPVSAYFGLLQAKINSRVRIWQTPSLLWCGRSLWMTPNGMIENSDVKHVKQSSEKL